MELFIDRLPITQLSIRLPVIVSEPGLLRPPPDGHVSDWFLDTGFTGEASAWRPHLEGAQIDPDVNPLDEGIVFRDQQISSSRGRTARPLLGMRLLRRARLKLDIDFGTETVSVWVPSLYQAPFQCS